MIFIALMVLVTIAVTIWVATLIIGWLSTGARSNKRLAQRKTIELHNAQRVIRRIANGTVDPQLEAEIYLDTYNSKEIDV